MLLFLTSIFAIEALAVPEGVENITILSSERRTGPTPVNITAQGGNISRLAIVSRRQTGAWQGFSGNISGSLVLDDASGDRFYLWNITNISGEIYASRNGTLSFATIFPVNNCTTDEIFTGGGADRVSRTYFNNTNTVNFSVGTVAINSSTACSARPFINSTQAATNLFENIILTNEAFGNVTATLNTSIYAGIVQGTSINGFDGQHYNFQLLVPVNRTSGFTTYFFYAELD